MKIKYKCKKCGSTYFVSQLNRYDEFESRDNKIYLTNSQFIDDPIELYCFHCYARLVIDDNDIII